MNFFDMDNLKESALDAFLNDPDLQNLWYKDADKEALQRHLEERQKKAPPVAKKTSVKAFSGMDGTIMELSLSSDKMQAWIELSPILQGVESSVLEGLIREELGKNLVTTGVYWIQINRLAKNPIFGKRIQVAQGKYPEENKEGAIHFNFDNNKTLRPKEADGFSINMERPDFVNLVKAGELLSNLSGEALEFAGHNVCGNKVYPSNCGLNAVEAGENVFVSPDGLKLYSVAEGEVFLQNGVLSVFPILRLPEIDPSMGEIKYSGSVYVTGDVKAGSKTEVQGNLIVGGYVESCNIVTGGNLAVASGIKGGDNSKVKVGGSLRSPFIEYMNVQAEGDIYTDVLLGAEIKCNGGIYALGKRGRIVGGNCCARGIYANDLGNSAGAKTVLEIPSTTVGETQMQEKKELLDSWVQRQEAMEEMIQTMRNPAKAKVLIKVLDEINRQVEKEREELEKLQQKVDMILSKYHFEIQANNMVYPKVTCIISGYIWRNERQYGRSRIYMKNGEIQVSFS